MRPEKQEDDEVGQRFHPVYMTSCPYWAVTVLVHLSLWVGNRPPSLRYDRTVKVFAERPADLSVLVLDGHVRHPEELKPDLAAEVILGRSFPTARPTGEPAVFVLAHEAAQSRFHAGHAKVERVRTLLSRFARTVTLDDLLSVDLP